MAKPQKDTSRYHYVWDFSGRGLIIRVNSFENVTEGWVVDVKVLKGRNSSSGVDVLSFLLLFSL